MTTIPTLRVAEPGSGLERVLPLGHLITFEPVRSAALRLSEAQMGHTLAAHAAASALTALNAGGSPEEAARTAGEAAEAEARAQRAAGALGAVVEANTTTWRASLIRDAEEQRDRLAAAAMLLRSVAEQVRVPAGLIVGDLERFEEAADFPGRLALREAAAKATEALGELARWIGGQQ